MMTFFLDPTVKANYPTNIVCESTCSNVLELHNPCLKCDGNENPDHKQSWQWNMFFNLPTALPVVASLSQINLVLHSWTQVSIHDATSKDSLRHLMGKKAQHQPDHNELSTFHILADGRHFDLIIPFSHAFPRDTALNEGFVESLQAHRLTLEQPAKETMATSTVPPTTPTPPIIPVAASANQAAMATSLDAPTDSTSFSNVQMAPTQSLK